MMESNSDSFSLYQVKSVISDSEDSDNIVENSEDEAEHEPYDIPFSRRKKKIQVISSDDEDEVPAREHSAPVLPVVSATSSLEGKARDNQKNRATDSHFARPENIFDPDTRTRPGQDRQACAPKCVPSKVEAHGPVQRVKVRTSPPNHSSVQGASNVVQSLPMLPQNNSTSNSEVSNKRSVPMQSVVPAVSSLEDKARNNSRTTAPDSHVARHENIYDPDTRNRPGQNLKSFAPKYVSSKLEAHASAQPVKVRTSPPNSSTFQGASNVVQSLAKVPQKISTSHSKYFSGADNSKETATITSKHQINSNSKLKSDGVIVLSDSEEVLVVNKEQELQEKISKLIKERDKMKMILRSSDLASLPDNGARLQMQVELYDKNIRQLKFELQHALLNNVAISKTLSKADPSLSKTHLANSFPQQPPSARPVGMKTLETLRVEKSLTNDALERLHGSIKSCPSEETLADDPDGLKTSIQLMPHQKRALAWLLWREMQNPSGGILADDMGLGKTLTMITLIMKSKQEKLDAEGSDDSSEAETEKENWCYGNKRKMEKGGTLVICPASLLNQWEEEVVSKCKRGLLEVEVYHGQQRDKPRRLARKDIVITTYNLIRTEAGVLPLQRGNANTSERIATMKGNLFQVRWERVILDEAHVVRNHKSQTSVAVCLLRARSRWALTGTPIHNKELDLYALLKFLRCSPFDDILVWRRWVDNKNAAGQQRLNTVVNSIMLRRTKAQLQEKGALQCLPEKKHELIYVHLDEDEFEVYQKVLIFSKTLFAQFLHQRAEKEQNMEAKYGQRNTPTYEQDPSLNDPAKISSELAAWQQKVAGMTNIESFQILVLILRLRQLCCHPSLIKAMLEKDVCEADGIEDDDGTDVDLLTQFSNLGLNSNPHSSDNSEANLKTNVLTLDNPVFKRERVSSKMKVMLEKIQENILGTGDKAIVVSQWTSMLDIVGDHLQMHGISCQKLTGAVPVKDRMNIVSSFNKSTHGPNILLLSLTAGGVGLNLVGANHLFLFDLHWNPQLEAQACDRIYRYGQTKTVHIYKFVCEDTIEQRIKILQDAKLSVATNVLNGARNVGSNKLSLNDLKMLFSM